MDPDNKRFKELQKKLHWYLAHNPKHPRVKELRSMLSGSGPGGWHSEDWPGRDRREQREPPTENE